LATVKLLTELTEVFEPAGQMTWSDMRQEGTVASWYHVGSMINRIGISTGWTFLVVTIHTRDGEWFAQSCRDGIDRLVAEINTDERTVMVVLRGASRASRRLVTSNPEWKYFANRAELHGRRWRSRSSSNGSPTSVCWTEWELVPAGTPTTQAHHSTNARRLRRESQRLPPKGPNQ
jgi:hypothetical protein